MKMKYEVAGCSDRGAFRAVNQDSMLIKHARYKDKEILFAAICDGVGGLSDGELASATIVRAFDRWFHKSLPWEIDHLDTEVLTAKIELLLRQINCRIAEYAAESGKKMGTTFTGLLMIDERMILAHVGDTRAYYIGENISRLSEDHTVVAQEIQAGRLTQDQAKTDKRRHILTQCIGTGASIAPQLDAGKVLPGIYILCSDGFRQQIEERELFERISSCRFANRDELLRKCSDTVELCRSRGEKDNISAILIKAAVV